MQLYYSKSIHGFYDDTIHTPEQIPTDAVPITPEYHQALLIGQGRGRVIQANSDGFPILVDYVPTPEYIREMRDEYLRQMDVVIANPLRWNSFSDLKKQEWVEYRQSLLDVPQQPAFPLNVTWPTAPNA